MPVRLKDRRIPGKWRVTVWHKGVRKEWIFDGSRADALGFEARKRLELEAFDPSEIRSVPTFSDFSLTRYKTHAQLHLKASSWEIRRFQVATLIQFFGPRKLNEISLEDIERYQRVRQVPNERANDEVTAGRLRPDEASLAVGAKARTINDELTRMVTILRYAKKLGIATNIPEFEKLRVRKSSQVRYFTEDEVQRIFAAAAEKASEMLPMLVVMLNTGLRKGEAIHLRWDQVDFERRLLRIWPHDDPEHAERDDETLEAWSPKHDRAREVPFEDVVEGVLRAQESRALSGEWVFPSPRTEHVYASWPKLTFNRVMRSAGVKGSPHMLRHTFASLFLQRVPDLFLLAEVLGHSSTRTTKIYAHLMPNHLARARGAVAIAPTGAAPLDKTGT